MISRRILLLAALLVATSAWAQAKPRIEKAADIPRFSYRIEMPLENVVRDEAAFRKFAAEVRRDNQSVLDGYDIADKAAQRQLLTVLAVLDYLEGRYAEAGQRAEAVRALEEKPSDKLISALQLRSMVAAQKATGTATGEAFRKEVARILAAELRTYPYALVENDVKGMKSSAELLGESLALGNVRDRLQPVVTKAGGALSSDLAPGVVFARYSLVARIPLRDAVVDTLSAYLAANKVEKPDIWAKRDIALPPGQPYATVPIAVWDSGVDSALFRDQLLQDKAAGKRALIAFDLLGNPSGDELLPIPAALQSKLPSMKSRTKGLSDLQSNIDSPEAAEVKKLLSQLKPQEYRATIEELTLASHYAHGTHVAGIAMQGNPYARLAISRITFDYKLLPDPCITPELVARNARNYGSYVAYLKAQGVRVANMSWGGSVKGFETTLEVCNIGKSAEERKTLAREYFAQTVKALTEAMAGAPGILFVTSAGNANQNSTFAEAYPVGISLPNVISVGAVDKAGDEAPFTSYGPTVRVHANGYQVESYLPGGERVALSGTSMSAPQVTNLAAKMLAVNPKLTPPELVSIILGTAEKTADGRRVLVHPAKAVEAARKRA